MPKQQTHNFKARSIVSYFVTACILQLFLMPVPSSQAAIEIPNSGLDFGGMYGYFRNPANGARTPYPHPQTGADRCPEGYSSASVLGSNSVDYTVVLCYRAPLPGQPPLFDFGGMYGYGQGGLEDPKGFNDGSKEILVNPATGRDSCPSGFSSAKVLGTPNVDWSLFYCYRAHQAGQTLLAFGGIFSSGINKDGNLESFKNPVTDMISCPSGFWATSVLGSKNRDFNLRFCAHAMPLPASIVANNNLFFVSPSGNDSWSGMRFVATAAGTDGPFRTLSRARDAVRAHRNSAIGIANPKPYIIYMRRGQHELAAGFVLDDRDSGTLVSPLTIQSYPGEIAEIVGSKRISGFTQEGENIFKKKLSAGTNFNTLFINGKRAIRARMPNTGYLHRKAPRYYKDPITQVEDTTKTIGLEYFGEDINPDAIEVGNSEIVVIKAWKQSRSVITSVDRMTNTMLVSDGNLTALREEIGSPTAYYIENSRLALDAPGEWYLDKSNSTLYYYPQNGEQISNIVVSTPVTSELLRIEPRTSTQYVSYIRLRNLTFAESDWSMNPAIGHVGSQSSHRLETQQPVHVKRGQNIVIADSMFRSLGGSYALESFAQDAQIISNVFVDLAGGGVRMRVPLDQTENILMRNKVVANKIFRTGSVFKESSGILGGIMKDTLIAQNTITDTSYTGISLGWQWDDRATFAANNVIEKNNLKNVMQEMMDGAAIYTLGNQPGTRISENRIENAGLAAELDYPLLDFGGMYGHGWQGGGPVTYANPAAGNTASCPEGYEAQQVYGAFGTDYRMYSCWRRHLQGRDSALLFGGIFSFDPVTNLVKYKNPATNAASCPVGYQTAQALGAPNVDGRFYYCYRAASPGLKGIFDFGGFQGMVNGLIVPNPFKVPGLPCPKGFSETTPNSYRVLSTPGRDATLLACIGYRNFANGIYLDQGSSGITVRHNTITKVASSGFFVNPGHDNIIEFNTIIDPGKAGITGNNMDGPVLQTNVWFRHNTIRSSTPYPLAFELRRNNILPGGGPMINQITGNQIFIGNVTATEAQMNEIIEAYDPEQAWITGNSIGSP